MADKSRIKGITIEIGGDATGLDKALKGVNKSLSNTQDQLSDVKKLLKLDPGNTDLLRQKHELLARSVTQTKDKLGQLKDAEKQLLSSGVDKHSDQYMALQREIIETENRLEDLTKAAKESNVALGKIGAAADKVAEGAQKVADATSGLSKAAAAGLGAAAGVATKIVDSYADYEQLVGGVETLFGDAADAILRKADNAYRTAGLSANEYMETATGFAASLVSGLGGDTQRAAELADVAITDMADNANKMGSGIESIQNAYQGFAKQNYTMLDNLKLGYGGTAEEMVRLIKESGVLGDAADELTTKNLSELASFDKIIEAIHITQERMGVAGTTAAEAEETISGSVNAFKGAVSNLMAGMGDANADIDQLVDNVMSSFETMAGNIIPILQNIWDHLPGGAKFALGAMAVLAGVSPIASGIASISTAVSTLTSILPKLGTVMQAVFTSPITWIVALVALIAVKGDEIQAVLQKVDDFLQGVFAKDWTEIFGPVLGNILNGFFANLKNIWDNIKQVFDGIIDFIRGVFTGDWERAWNGVKEIFGGAFKALVSLAKAPINGIIALLNGAISGINWMIDGLNKLHFEVPDWVPLLGGKSFGLNIARIGSIPYLAKGGILSQGSAIVGEAGPELLTMSGGRAVVQPLNSTTTNHNLGGVSVYVYGAPGQSVDDLADAVMDRMQSAVARKGAALA